MWKSAQSHHSPLEGESQQPSHKAQAAAVGGDNEATDTRSGTNPHPPLADFLRGGYDCRMNKLDQAAPLAQVAAAGHHSERAQTNGAAPAQAAETGLRSEVEKSLLRYFQHLEDEPVTDLHRLVMSEVEAPLLGAVMRHTGNNQSKASIMLGLNRSTLRTKLKHYGML